LVVGVAHYGGTISSVTDTAGNTWSEAILRSHPSSDRASIWYAKNCAGGANTVTVNFSGNTYGGIAIAEYSGCDTAAPLDVTAGGHGGSGGEPIAIGYDHGGG
jgi:hypothetical protein